MVSFKRNRVFAGVAAAVLTSILTACGGGSSGGGGSTSFSSPPAASSSASSSSVTASSSSSAASSLAVVPSGAAAKPGFELVFSDEFDTLDVSANGPGTKWTAHTAWHGDFGDATFADPVAGFPFTVSNGILRIEARKDANGKWKSGLLASVDPNNNGFSQQYGYFEVRAKFPPGEGTWPAFWLDSLVPSTSSDPSLEVDGIEYYGQFPTEFHSTVTLWPHDKSQKQTSTATISKVASGSLTSDFHVYGIDVEPDRTHFYLDGVETWSTPTPTEHRHGLMILINLGLGGGWPIANTPSPSYMYVDYVRAYKKAGA